MTLVLLVLDYVLRLVAGNCHGADCDWFIPASVLLPVLILIFVAVTGLRAFFQASNRPQDRGWALSLAILTVVGVLGPVLSLVLLRDSPDSFVPIATILMAVVPIAALVYAATRTRHA